MDSPGNILIIDDDPSSLQMLATILNERGHKVRGVTNGQMGLIAAQKALPELILLDVTMPDMNGYDVCRTLKNDEQLQHIPVIFISALDETLDKVKAFQSGGIDYITKPFQHEEVVLRVENHLSFYRLYLRSQEMAKMEERQRIARDLHDAVTQTLFSASMMAETLLLSSMDEKISAGLRRIQQLTQGALAEMRALLIELRPEALETTDLGDLLHYLAQITIARTKTQVDVQIDQDVVLDPEVKMVFYRVAQEALNNVFKHARADRVVIELRYDERLVLLRIGDNGQGFDLANLPTGHFGIDIMGERARTVNASLVVNSAISQGTEVVLTYRLPPSLGE
jgi:two-component system, sensor histidine kinase and response regulator